MDSLSLSFAEYAKGTHNITFCYIRTFEKKRAEQIEKIFTQYDKEVPDGMRIKLTSLPCEPAIIGFARGNEYTRHVIYKEIQRLKHNGDPSYRCWTPDLSALHARNALVSREEQDIRVEKQLMEEDPVAFGIGQDTGRADNMMSDDDVVICEAPSAVLQPLRRPSSSLRQLEQPAISSFFRRVDNKQGNQEDQFLRAEIDSLKRKLDASDKMEERITNMENKINRMLEAVQALSGIFLFFLCP